ncbi:sugar transferase [Pontibacter liquoris]|uniref:sugar transferase n=1 Tax=Pontibacter liquoris TaxID=2905677 RepID=UPI001FA6E5D4|nr:sugar transferase [Pontibacter liquoris]
MYRSYLKRIIDFIVSSVALLLFLPIIVILTILLWVVNQGKPFFYQSRPGKNEKEFLIIKFKTMTDERDENGDLLPDNQRMTSVGRFVRKTSLDELPQLMNVLKGDMSLVGPRPLLFKYIPLYTQEQKRRHEVRPGITGWAQVNGRNSISWTKKFNYDIEYVDNISFKLDFQILWLTFQKVIKREGVNQSEERPMQPFNGKN